MSEHDHQSEPINEDPYVVGKWETIDAEFQGSPTHAALLPNNKIFVYGGSSLDYSAFEYPPPAEILDLDTMKTHRIAMEGVEGDLWCGGHTLMQDGSLLFLGGTEDYAPGGGEGLFKGLDHAYRYDPFKDKWTRLDDMYEGRWYPTAIRLADNSVMVLAGFPKGEPGKGLKIKDIIQPVQEILRENKWSKMEEERTFPLYPRLHLLPDGDVFYSGVFNTHFLVPGLFPSMRWSHENRSWQKLGGKHKKKSREEGISLLMALRPPNYEPKVLIAGGGNAALNRGLAGLFQRWGVPSWIEKIRFNNALDSVEMIDLSQDIPRWGKKSCMNYPRIHAVGTLLPDGKVFVVGGMTRHGHLEGSQIPKYAVREPEMYNPERDVWSLMPPQKKNRVYHSTALLLPDGRVISMGSNPHSRVIEKSIEIYSPPYLFRGERPVISKPLPKQIAYNEPFKLKVDKAHQINQVVLRRPDVITHVTNTDQRLLQLDFEVTGKKTLEVRGPLNPAHMPQGYCMLFVLNAMGVPSIAPFVMVK